MKSVRLTHQNFLRRQIGLQYLLGIVSLHISPHTKVSNLQNPLKLPDMVNHQVTVIVRNSQILL